jgi:hypothetical protein
LTRRRPRSLGARRGGLVVDDVVDAGCMVFERECGGVVEVDERGDAATVAYDD